MTDLVKELNDASEPWFDDDVRWRKLCKQAADKIDSIMKYAERLRQDCIALQGEIGRLTDNNPSPERILHGVIGKKPRRTRTKAESDN